MGENLCKSSLYKRILAIVIDQIIFSFLAVIILVLLLGINGSYVGTANYRMLINSLKLTTVIVVITYFCKDIINARSVGKRIMKLVVREYNNYESIPNKKRIILRNITVIIWPVEIILVLINKNRIGDVIAKTIVLQQCSRN